MNNPTRLLCAIKLSTIVLLLYNNTHFNQIMVKLFCFFSKYKYNQINNSISYSRGQQTGIIMNDAQFQQLLEVITTGINPTRPSTKFSRTPVQAIITDVIYYYLARGIKLWKEYKKLIHIKINMIGG